MELISFPFRINPDRSIATVTDGSEDHHAEVVAVTVLTRKGERPLVPLFGVSDPAFAELDTAEVNANLATFGPLGLQVELVDAETIDETTQALTFDLVSTDPDPEQE